MKTRRDGVLKNLAAFTLLAVIPTLAQDQPALEKKDGRSIEELFRDALYLEEVKGDAEAALTVYESVTALFER